MSHLDNQGRAWVNVYVKTWLIGNLRRFSNYWQLLQTWFTSDWFTSDGSKYRHGALDRTIDEIRILRFQSQDNQNPDILRCTLHHVSLNDHLPDYWGFLTEFRYEYPGTEFRYESSTEATKRWLEEENGQSPWLSAEVQRLSISGWRYRADQYSVPEYMHEWLTLPAAPRFAWGDFEAISYCWESEDRNNTVMVNGKTCKVTANLEALLHQLRQLPEASSGMGFWIDGLCINQDDIAEKNHQVRLMKRIYTQALSTIIWLGPGNEASDRAANAIERHEKSRSDDTLSLVEWELIFELWSRNYFKRMWIIQELAMNKNLSFFMCGNRQISRQAMTAVSSSALRMANLIAGKMMTSGPAARTPGEIWQLTYHIDTLLWIKAPKPKENDQSSLEQLLDLARKAEAKDSRDKIYGLLGLLHHDISSKIQPDYDKSKDDVFTEFATVLLERCGTLDELLCWCRFAESATLASWVPDWNLPLRRNHLQWFRKRRAGGHQILISPPSGTVLHVKGIRIGTVAFSSLSSTETLPYGRAIQPRPEEEKTTTYGNYSSSDGLRDALNRTLAHDHPMLRPRADLTDIYWVDWQTSSDSTNNRRPLLESNDSMSDHWKRFEQFRQSNANFLIFGHNLRDFFPARTSVDQDSDCFFRERERSDIPLTDFEANSDSTGDSHATNIKLTAVALQGRRLITTHCGYLGLAPEEVSSGDTIAVLLGCNYPVILRQHGEGFKYVGECYIDGVMDGGVVDAAHRGECDVEDILIL